MKLEKPSERMLGILEGVARNWPGVETRRMFGQAAAFVNGNMFMGLFGERFNVRLGPADRDEALGVGAEPFEPMGRAMREYVLLPAHIVDDEAALRAWAGRAYSFASQLAPKVPKRTVPPGVAKAARRQA